MNARQENKISMYYKVRLFFTNHLATFSTAVPDLTTAVASFNDKLDQLAILEQTATEPNSGYAAQKQANRQDMRNKAIIIAAGITALAIANEDKALQAKVAITKSGLDALRDTEVLFLAENLNKLAMTNAAALVPKGITSTKLCAFEAAVSKFRDSIQSPADQRSESAAAGIEVDNKMIEIDNTLLLIDALMDTQSLDQPLLYNKYYADRAIDDNASGNAKPDVNIIIPANSFAILYKIPYSASRQFRLNNKGAGTILWGLSISESEFTFETNQVDAKSESIKQSKTLAPTGDILMAKNTGVMAIEVDVYVIE